MYAGSDSSLTDWSRPVTKCVATDYSRVASNNTIYNKDTLTEDMWIELPAYAKQFAVSGIFQIHPNSGGCSIPMCSVRQKNIWVRIPIEVVDTSPGDKIYRIEFKNTSSLERMWLYFSYTIQDDKPCRSYVYM